MQLLQNFDNARNFETTKILVTKELEDKISSKARLERYSWQDLQGLGWIFNKCEE